MKQYFNIPNLICYFRVLLTFWSFYYFLETSNKYVFAVLVVVIILLDGLDGIVARRLNQCTDFGAKLDIVCDRLVELLYWFFFALLGYIGYWVFIYFLIRGLIVDWISFKNTKPLGDSWLRSSRIMRFASGLAKILSFIALAVFPGLIFTKILVYLTVLINFLRGLPVLLKTLERS